MTRKALRSIGAALVGLLLFAQLAVAAYACPGLPSEHGIGLQVAYASSGNDGMSNRLASTVEDQVIDCADMAQQSAPASSNLCAEHCHYGQQSNQAPTIIVPAALINERYSVPVLREPASVPRQAATDENSPVATRPPPHAILHCCFRI